MARPEWKAALLASAIGALTLAAQAEEHYGIGRAATPEEIAGWNIDIGRDGSNLPSGSGSVERGRVVFSEQCATCHGADGQGGLGDRLAGGQGTLASLKPIRTVGSYWPYASTLFDYIRRAMPQNAPQSLSNEDVYAVSAYILNLNGVVPADAVLDAKTLAAIRMPNRDGFVTDPRPDVHNH
ncbi:c-type cytochrome [Bradyrhizobium lablabi]|uniref:c-type cytochrome n=1 Tax=Bradyrhizobium lablabi TaxID=722472 RepID=UPI001BA81BC5|nr:cytochrome c [Bradyrhizobium lablabi]MBR0696455.1 cytochrome c [Bradyrhizobium lablabi]